MDEILKYLGQIGEFAQHWPDLCCCVVGSLFGFTLTGAVERYWLPTVTLPDEIRRQQGLTFLICWASSAIASEMLWAAWDPADPLRVRAITSAVVSILGFFVYPVVIRLVMKYVPAIGSAWAPHQP